VVSLHDQLAWFNQSENPLQGVINKNNEIQNSAKDK
jgi:hypothetical protein